MMPVKTFISYHHANDQWAKDHLANMNWQGDIFDDYSVNSGDIDDSNLTDEQIRVIVRDQYLRDATVTIVLVGTETRYRKHVDWELYSSMRDSPLNAKSGVLLIALPSTGINNFTATHGAEETLGLYPHNTNWVDFNRRQYEDAYPHFSTRMIDNLAEGTAKMSVVPWNYISNSPEKLRLSIELAHRDRMQAVYNFDTLMRRRNGTGPRR